MVKVLGFQSRALLPIVVGFFVGFGGGTVNGWLEVVVLGVPELLTLLVPSGGAELGSVAAVAGGASVVAALMPSDLLRRCLDASGLSEALSPVRFA